MKEKGFRRATLAVLAVGMGVAALPVASQAVSGGNPVPDGTYRFLASITAGGKGCTGSLISASWVITSATCVPDGAAVTVSVGGAAPVAVAKVTRNSSRDVAVVKLATPVNDITPLALATTVPAVNDTLKIAGVGRTAGDWVPEKAQVADYKVTATTATTLSLLGEKDTCLGDAGGPAIREVNGKQELVALHKTSWQNGCLLVQETRKGTTETRVDDLGSWVRNAIENVPVFCAPAPIWAARANGDLHRYVHTGAVNGDATWSGGDKVGNGWLGRTLAGGKGVVWDFHKKIDGNDPFADGSLKRWVWDDATRTWSGGGQVGQGWERYLTPEYRNRITVDSKGRIWMVDDQGRLRYYVWDDAANNWVNAGGETVETGWEQYNSITAAGDGVLYARKPDGKLYRYQYNVTTKQFIQRAKHVGGGWEMFSEITSPGADVLYGRGALGKDPWSDQIVPVLRWYLHHDNTDTWAPGAPDGTGKSIGSGWDTELSVSAEPGSCTLRRFGGIVPPGG